MSGIETVSTQADYELRLYVIGQTQTTLKTIANLRAICEAHVDGYYRIEVVDLLRQPQLAEEDQILAVPTLVRCLPLPLKRVIGTLADTEKVLVGLDLRTAGRGGLHRPTRS
jgi:circadian clock protein KaiB